MNDKFLTALIEELQEIKALLEVIAKQTEKEKDNANK